MKNEYLMILIYMYNKYTNYIAVRKERDEARGTTRKSKGARAAASSVTTTFHRISLQG